jgi:hypothetical protein
MTANEFQERLWHEWTIVHNIYRDHREEGADNAHVIRQMHEFLLDMLKAYKDDTIEDGEGAEIVQTDEVIQERYTVSVHAFIEWAHRAFPKPIGIRPNRERT